MALEIDVLPVESSPDRADANIAGVLLLLAIDDNIDDDDDAGGNVLVIVVTIILDIFHRIVSVVVVYLV